jgi:alpha-tubulin suppressor-like RCC1 family protein
MAVVCGFSKTTALTEDGDLYAWGIGEPAQLGFYGPRARPVPLLVGFPQVFPDRRYVMISAGIDHYAALAEDGSVWTWGIGRYGVLGHSDNEDRLTPTRLHRTAFRGCAAVMVACGTHHTMVVTADGRLWTFGNAVRHVDIIQNVPRLVFPFHFWTNEIKISMVVAGSTHSIALTSDGDVFTWGSGQHGQLGHNEGGLFEEKLLPARLDSAFFGGSMVLFIAAGEHNSAAVTEEGSLFVWGNGQHGQLGLGDNNSKLIPTCIRKEAFNGASVRMVSCSTYSTLAVTNEGRLFSWGSLGHNVPTRVDQRHFSGAKIVTAAAGPYVSTAVTEDGQLYSWGKVRDPHRSHYIYTGLGHIDIIDKLVPTRVDPDYMQGARVGRWHCLRSEYALAFVMGLHSRLGAGTDTFVNILDDTIAKMVLDLCIDCTGIGSSKLNGLIRLMGGCLK